MDFVSGLRLTASPRRFFVTYLFVELGAHANFSGDNKLVPRTCGHGDKQFMTTEITQESQPRASTHSALPTPSKRRYVSFGAVQVDLLKEAVTKDGSRIKLPRKAYSVLLALLERPGEIVTRESLYQRLWPPELNIDKHTNLNMTINKLRRSLGDSSLKPLYIETIPRRGYVFVAHPQASDRPGEVLVSNITQTNTSSLHQSEAQAFEAVAKPAFSWIAQVVGLILIGVLFGAGIWIAAWISYQHHAAS
jgi:DNA-binding winged helix-turn-helix (wHTH) protein